MAFHTNPLLLLSDMEGSSAGRRYAHSVHGGSGGRGTRISSVSSSRGSFSGGQSLVPGAAEECFAIGNEKVTMQHLNSRLASYLETVRNLEQANSTLELKITQALEKRGPDLNDYSRYDATLRDLQKKILEAGLWNYRLALQMDDAHLDAKDFRLKMEYEMGVRQIVEADVAALRKILDDTNVVILHLENDVESLREELITLTKNHQIDVLEVREQISHAGVQVEVDAPTGQDLASVMEEMRAKYEKTALKNQEEIKAWHQSKISAVQVQVTENTAALTQANATVSENRRSLQTLQIELQSHLSLKSSLEGTLRDVEMRYNLEMQKYNGVLVQLQTELSELRSSIALQTQEHEALFNIRMELEAEIAMYRRLLEGQDFRLEDAVMEVKESQVVRKVVTFTQTLVDGKLVSETKDVQHHSALEDGDVTSSESDSQSESEAE